MTKEEVKKAFKSGNKTIIFNSCQSYWSEELKKKEAEKPEIVKVAEQIFFAS